MTVVSLGTVKAVGTQGRGHTAEEWTDMLLNRIIGETKNAPEPIRLQAQAFRDQIRQEILWHMQEVIKSDRTTLANRLRRAGLDEVATIVEGF